MTDGVILFSVSCQPLNWTHPPSPLFLDRCTGRTRALFSFYPLIRMLEAPGMMVSRSFMTSSCKKKSEQTQHCKAVKINFKEHKSRYQCKTQNSDSSQALDFYLFTHSSVIIYLQFNSTFLPPYPSKTHHRIRQIR